MNQNPPPSYRQIIGHTGFYNLEWQLVPAERNCNLLQENILPSQSRLQRDMHLLHMALNCLSVQIIQMTVHSE